MLTSRPDHIDHIIRTKLYGSYRRYRDLISKLYLLVRTKMKDLVTVNLTYNEIEIIEIDAFDDLDSLTALYLR